MSSGAWRPAALRSTVDSVTAPGEATRCATRICSREEHPVIIVGGGDGTVNGVINGLPFGRATVAVVPLGTANVLAQEVGIRSLDDAVERIVTGATRTPAIGLLQADRRKQYFLLMAGVGLRRLHLRRRSGPRRRPFWGRGPI